MILLRNRLFSFLVFKLSYNNLNIHSVSKIWTFRNLKAKSYLCLLSDWVMKPQKLLKDHKHDTHLFVQVNQATNAWSFRQSFDSVCTFESLHNVRNFSCSERSNFCKIDKHTNCTLILSKGPCICSWFTSTKRCVSSFWSFSNF